MMDLHARMKAAVDRKKRQQALLDAVRAGQLDGILPAGEHFRRVAEAPPPPPRDDAATLLEALPHARLEGADDCRVVLLESRADANAEAPVAEWRLPLEHADALDQPGALQALFPALATEIDGLRPEEIAFLDTETTGLAGGAGTLAFLVGIGWLERDGAGKLAAFRLVQLLVEDYCHEPAMLDWLAARLKSFRALATYNGRSFDMPLLRARGVLNRIRPGAWALPNLDLLPPSRRFWRGTLENVRLVTVERDILGIARGEDVPGAEIPAVWDAFARTGRPGLLPLVVRHNAQDIASLAGLLARLVAMTVEPERPGLMQRWSELAAAARACEARGERERATRLIDRALERLHDGPDHDKLLLLQARLLRRLGRDDAAVDIWRGMMGLPLHRSLPAWIEAAKHEEHVRRDHAAARGLVSRALRQVELEEELRILLNRPRAPLAPRLVEDLHRRAARLDRKLARATPATGPR